MSKAIRRLALASALAAVLALVPFSVSTAGGVDVNGACASGACEPTPRGLCVQPDSPPVANAKPAVG